jgi:hypothetical protein
MTSLVQDAPVVTDLPLRRTNLAATATSPSEIDLTCSAVEFFSGVVDRQVKSNGKAGRGGIPTEAGLFCGYSRFEGCAIRLMPNSRSAKRMHRCGRLIS